MAEHGTGRHGCPEATTKRFTTIPIPAIHGRMARQNHLAMRALARLTGPERLRQAPAPDLPAAVFDPETLAVMLGVLDEVSRAVAADEPARSRLAQRILAAVRQGERDPARLRACALRSMVN
jgi:hypothetical protein